MAYSVAENYASALLHHLGDVANGNDPGKKITPPGFLRSLNENNFAGTVINEGYEENGHIRNARISYMPRFPESLVGTTESCDPDIVPWDNEITTDITKYVELGIYIDDRTIARYVEAASRTVNVGAPAAPGVMQQHLDAVKNAANALFTKMNRILLAKQELAWGTNVANATTTKTVNFNDDTNVNLFTEGLGEILDDYQLNEGQGTPIIVGGGLFNKYVMQQKAKGIAQNGINTAGFEADYKYYYDIISQTEWGTNEIGVFQPGAIIPILSYNKYKGPFAGDKQTSFNFTINLPVSDISGNPLSFITFDAKLMRINCPTTIAAAPYAGTQAIKEGWKLMISKMFDMINIPTDAYVGTDRLTGNNGTLRYVITNS